MLAIELPGMIPEVLAQVSCATITHDPHCFATEMADNAHLALFFLMRSSQGVQPQNGAMMIIL